MPRHENRTSGPSREPVRHRTAATAGKRRPRHAGQSPRRQPRRSTRPTPASPGGTGMTCGRTYMHDAADTSQDTPSVTRNIQIVIDVMDSTQAAREKVQAFLRGDVPARSVCGSLGGTGHRLDPQVLDADDVKPPRD